MKQGPAAISAGEKAPNPIYERFTRSSGWPTLPQTYWLAVALVLACTALMAWLPSVLYYNQLVYTLILPSGIVAVSPVVFSIYAVNLADQLNRGIDHQMIRLTPLTTADIREGFIRVAIFRLRVPLILVTGLAPALALLFTTELGWYMPLLVERLLTGAIGFAYAVAVWVISRVSISFAVNTIMQGKTGHRALISTVLAVILVSVMLYFVTGFAAFSLAVWVTIMTTVVF